MSIEQEDDGGLVMPFVMVASKGGPYDDSAYVAGYEAGRFDQLLADGARAVSQIVRTNNVPQIDLIAMRYGLVATAKDIGHGWSDIYVHPETL